MSADALVADPLPITRVMLGKSNPSDSVADGKTAPQNRNLAASESITNREISSTATSVLAFNRDLLELTKPRIVTMVLVTALVAAVVAAGGAVPFLTLVHLLIGVAMVAGSASAMNQVWERQIDGEMERTRRRPLPAGRISVWTAFAFSILLGVLGTAHLAFYLGWMPAIIGIVTWSTYVPLYTPLKTRSAWNTTVGAVSGALPVLIGYTAAGGQLADLRGWLLVGVLVAWQYPHFMAIAWLYRRQYGEAGFKMTTTVEPTGRSAGWQSVLGMMVLVGCLLGLALSQATVNPLRLTISVVCLLAISYPMTKAAWRFAADRNDGTARKLLRASLLQLPASLLLVTVSAIF